MLNAGHRAGWTLECPRPRPYPFKFINVGIYPSIVGIFCECLMNLNLIVISTMQ